MPNKSKWGQPELLDETQGRDMFQTPRYATELLIPFIPKQIKNIWECACGQDKIVNVLKEYGYIVSHSDLASYCTRINFLTDTVERLPEPWAIITNPPFSLKQKFYLKCREYGVPFALLIPADYSGWVIRALQDGCEKIIPIRRIDYITPTGLSGLTGHTSNFHSLWLTWGFNLGKSETFVELTTKMKEMV